MSMHLYLMRHAKSSWDNPDLSDFERPLNQRGQKAAPLIGRVIRERELLPAKILCSPSKRTRETLDLVLSSSGLTSPVDFVDGIYEATVGGLRKILRSTKNKFESVLLIGHNPGMEGLLQDLTGDYEHFPTATLASIDLDIDDWHDLDPGCGVLEFILRPRNL